MFTLVPSNFFDPASARQTLSELGPVVEGEDVKYTKIDEYNAVLIFQNEDGIDSSVPPIYELLLRLPDCGEYNKILCSIVEDRLYLAIAQGKSLLLANSYQVQDFTTAEYFIFLAMKSLQLNPEMSTICWLSELGAEEEMSLYRYFKSVVQL